MITKVCLLALDCFCLPEHVVTSAICYNSAQWLDKQFVKVLLDILIYGILIF